MKIMPGTPGKSAGNGTEIRQDIVRFYKDSGLEPVAKEVMCVCVCVCFGNTSYISKNHHNHTLFPSKVDKTDTACFARHLLILMQ